MNLVNERFAEDLSVTAGELRVENASVWWWGKGISDILSIALRGKRSSLEEMTSEVFLERFPFERSNSPRDNRRAPKSTLEEPLAKTP